MKLNYIFLCIVGCLFISCSDDTEYEYINIATPITISVAEMRASVEVLPPQNIVESGKIYAYEQYIFVNDVDKGVHVIDNRNPLQPNIINFIKIPLNRDVSVKGNYLYADSGLDVVVFDISQIESIQQVERLENVIENHRDTEYPENVSFFNWPSDLQSDDIIIGWDITVERREILDVETFEISNASDGSTGSGGSLARFKIVDDYLYVVDSYKINVFDIQNLDAPIKVNEEGVTWQAETIFYQEDKLFIGTRTGMYIYDITQPSTPQYISDFDHARFCDPVVVDGDYAYVTLRAGASCMDGDTQMLDSRLEIINISDIYNPQLEETYIMDEPYGLGVKGEKLFICDGASGLKVYNKSDISNLELLQNYNTNTAYDVIPLQNKLLLIGGNTLTQYNYTNTGIELISEFTIQ
ncbi:MAG: LVIVD repeat-containing protein [Kordia sp.]|uniref:LVIVD repeat-containing protein n=1 Tax=Kordia sp. TaxID=1965332 RepID=UPI00385E2BF4